LSQPVMRPTCSINSLQFSHILLKTLTGMASRRYRGVSLNLLIAAPLPIANVLKKHLGWSGSRTLFCNSEVWS
jgi:hypothetical protein